MPSRSAQAISRQAVAGRAPRARRPATVQPPPSAPRDGALGRAARSALSASSAPATSASSPRAHLQDDDALPGLGQHLVTGSIRNPISWPRPSRSRPQAASTTASRPRSVRLRRRVSTLPRTGSTRRSGRSARELRAARAATRCRRGRPAGTSAHDRAGPTPGVARIGPGEAGADRQAAASSRGEVLGGVHGDVDRGRRSSASSISRAKMPRPPISANVRRRSRSPAVDIGTIATAWPSVAQARRPRAPACASASREAARADRGSGSQRQPEVEQRRAPSGRSSPGSSSAAWSRMRTVGLVQQLVHDRPGEPLDAARGRGASSASQRPSSRASSSRRIASAQRSQAGDRGHDVERRPATRRNVGRPRSATISSPATASPPAASTLRDDRARGRRDRAASRRGSVARPPGRRRAGRRGR